MKSKEVDNNKIGRPYKMESWCNALNIVLNDENTLFLSDKDLVFLVNKQLPIDSQIDKRTFENWKAGKFHPNEEIGRKFVEHIETALIKQKQLLGERLINDTTGQWTRYAWILERKFAEWNLKHISENINKNEHETVIQITTGTDEQKALIESIMYSDYKIVQPIQIEHKEVDSTDNEKEDEFDF